MKTVHYKPRTCAACTWPILLLNTFAIKTTVQSLLEFATIVTDYLDFQGLTFDKEPGWKSSPVKALHLESHPIFYHLIDSPTRGSGCPLTGSWD